MATEADQVEGLVAEMSLAEKIGQMTQAANVAITPAEVADLALGSVLSGGSGLPTPNRPEAWADMVGSFVEAATGSRLGVPLLYGVDAVHGHALVPGATVFPHNIGLGAAGDPALVERIGAATAVEMLATGIRWTFAPTVAVPHDIRWGRTYEGFGRDPALVASLGAAFIRGVQGGRPAVLTCPKHFLADGGTTWDTVVAPGWLDWWDAWGETWRIDQGDARLAESELRRLHLEPYRAAAAAGARTVMASYSSWNGDKLHGHRYLLTEVLKGEVGFDGFVVSDWMGIQQLDRSFEASVVAAINAGVDMVMVPLEFRRFIEVATAAVGAGEIPLRRIDDAVRRILTAKASIGLLDGDAGGDDVPLTALGRPEHRALAAEAARRSAVLLADNGVLPLHPAPAQLDVGGRAADDIGLQCGGWTAGWQGAPGPITGGTTLLAALRAALPGAVRYRPDGGPTGDRSSLGVACIAEPPYAEGLGDRAVPGATEEDRAMFARMRARCDRLILVVYSGRPLVIPDLVDEADAVIAAWLPGSEATLLPDLLLGRAPFAGRLPQPWPASEQDVEGAAGRPASMSTGGTS